LNYRRELPEISKVYRFSEFLFQILKSCYREKFLKITFPPFANSNHQSTSFYTNLDSNYWSFCTFQRYITATDRPM